MATVPSYRSTFWRLLGFLRPYKWSLVVSVLLAVGSQAAAVAIAFLTGNGLAAADFGPASARGRIRHAQRALREAAAAVVRLLRPAPDRSADVARDRRSPGRPLLPRLRP